MQYSVIDTAGRARRTVDIEVSGSPMMHDFWNATDVASRMIEFGNFTKNVALFGGACFVMAVAGPWPGSVHRAPRHDVDETALQLM